MYTCAMYHVTIWRCAYCVHTYNTIHIQYSMLTESSTAEEKVRNQKQENSQKENRQYDKESTALQHNPLTPNLKEESFFFKNQFEE